MTSDMNFGAPPETAIRKVRKGAGEYVDVVDALIRKEEEEPGGDKNWLPTRHVSAAKAKLFAQGVPNGSPRDFRPAGAFAAALDNDVVWVRCTDPALAREWIRQQQLPKAQRTLTSGGAASQADDAADDAEDTPSELSVDTVDDTYDDEAEPQF